MPTRTYSELVQLPTFEERYEYLKLQGVVAAATFGVDRYMNQQFYMSPEWRRVRQIVIARDLGCDLGVEGYELRERIYIHHMNPIVPDDIKLSNADILDPEFLISVSHRTHNAIHYGDASQLFQMPVERTPGDTKLW